MAVPLAAMWPLTRAWYGDRLDPGYTPSRPTRLQRLLSDAGLDSPFWRLA